MVWGSKKSAKPPAPPIPAKPERTPDEVMSEMLSKYQSHFYETSKTNSNPSADEAKRKIDPRRKSFPTAVLAIQFAPWSST